MLSLIIIILLVTIEVFILVRWCPIFTESLSILVFLNSVWIRFVFALDGVIDDKLLGDVFSKDENSIFLSHYQLSFSVKRRV